MIRNYLKIAWRNLVKNKVYSFINIGGLAVGVTACLLMLLYVRHELQYDAFFENKERIARVVSELKTPEAPISLALSPVLLVPALADYPEVQKATRFQPTVATVRFKDKLFNEPDVYYTEQATFEVFSYQFLQGSKEKALNQPNSMVITESFAKKYAGDTDLLGQSIQINKEFYVVTGIIADLPSNTDLKINALLSYDFSKVNSWVDDLSVFTFVLFKQLPNLPLFEQKLNKLSQQYIQPELKKMGENDYSLVFGTEILADIHYSAGKIEDTPKGNKQYSYLFLFLAFFVLVIALLNYINLLTAQASERTKEVGVRKANGAQKKQLISQFLFESLFLNTISVAISITLLEVSIPLLNDLLQIQLQASWQEISLGGSISLVLITLLGGLYPAFVLSDFHPLQALRGISKRYGHSLTLRQVITTFQFVLTVSMIVGVIVIYLQMSFLQKHNLGFDKDQILVVQLPRDSLAQAQGVAFANSLQKHSKVQKMTLGSGLEPDAMGGTNFRVNGKIREVMTRFIFTDEQFVPLLGMKIKEGRNLSLVNASDKNGAFLVNEAFVKMSGWKNPIGQPIEGFEKKGQVIGVVKNFNYRSLHNSVEPIAIVYHNTRPLRTVMLKIQPKNLAVVKTTWQSHYANFPLEYTFLDEMFDKQYHKDQLMMLLFNTFAFLTVFVSCLGLFSLVIFAAETRTKEIGIRKVLGASILQITTLISKDFLKLVMIAFVIASPIAYYFMDKWLADFAYRITISWWVFALAGVATISIALITVSWHSIKAALANPVKSLKTE
ncbi:MAG: ABC transporter permease [Cytophagia bacterium]|nr:MAG: ABC transporter permease [Cytophagales bacterium]TAG38692.1 MAG: ABC transporter permease [Cytophagia bacterium]